MLIYCAHCYGGKSKNKALVEAKIKILQKRQPDCTFVSPIHAFGFMYNTLSYDEGMKLCFSLLSKCDALLVLSEESEGVKREIEYAKQHCKPILWLPQKKGDGNA